MRKIFVALGLALAALISLPAFAVPISSTVNLGQVYTGSTPDGAAPWLTAVFTSETGLSSGSLTLTSHLQDSDFLGGANGVIGWALYLNDLSSATYVSGNQPSTIIVGSGIKTSPVSGPFNLGFGWNPPPGSRFDGNDTATFTLTFSNALNGDPFGGHNGYLSFAHVQGITGGCSGKIVDGSVAAGVPNGTSCTQTPPPVGVPEPADLGMFGMGLLLIGAFLGLRRRYS